MKRVDYPARRAAPTRRNPARLIHRQRGFAGAVFLSIALISIVIASLSYMSRSRASGVTAETATLSAGVILKHGADLKNGYSLMQVATGLSPVSITFDNDLQTGLFNQSEGRHFASDAPPPPKAYVGPLPGIFAYTYTTHAILPGIGGTSAYSVLITLGNLAPPVCKSLNHILYNDSMDLEPASSSATYSEWKSGTGGSGFNDSTTAASNYINRSEGCIKTSDGVYVYYKALAEGAIP
jgi:hypothetical protein